MEKVTRSKLFAKPEVQNAITASCRLLRETLGGLSFAEREEAVLAITGEAARVALEEELQELADEFGESVLVDGREFKRHEPGTVVVHSLCGGLRVTRHTYREQGVRNGPTIVPSVAVRSRRRSTKWCRTTWRRCARRRPKE